MRPIYPTPPSIPENQYDQLREMFRANVIYKDIARHFGVSISSVRRALERCGELEPGGSRRSSTNVPAGGETAGRVERVDVKDAILISDRPETLTGAFFGDPSPERLRLVQGDRF